MTYAGIKNSIVISIVLLLVEFMTYIPRMLKRRNKAGKSKKAFSLMPNLRPDKLNEKFLFLVWPMTVKMIRITLKEITSELVDNGVVYPSNGYIKLMKSPKNIRNETLSPTENTNLSVGPSLSDFSIWRIRRPGIIVKKKNPRTGLRIGIFKRIARSVKTRNTNTNRENPLFPKTIGDLIIQTLPTG